MGRTMSFYDLRDAMAQPGCPVCRLTAAAVEHYLDTLLWENVNDAGARHQIRAARGFCNQHAWQLVAGGSSLGAVIIVRDVLQNMLRLLENAGYQAPAASLSRRAKNALDGRRPPPANTRLVAELGPQAACPACAQARTTEEVLIATLIEGLLGDDGLLPAYQSSQGLCLRHFRQALAEARNPAVFEALVGAQRAKWERLVEQLSEIVRKEDYRFRDEPRGEEIGASLRAIAALCGPRPSAK